MKTIMLLALAAIVLSQIYGFAYADTDPVVTVTTDSTSYVEGEVISVSGYISDYNESDPYKNFDVTLRVIAPNNNIISISQIPLGTEGIYSTSISVGGPLWKSDGDYTISVSHGSDRSASVTFAFVAHEVIEEEVIEEEVIEEEVIEVSEEELSKGCGTGTHLEDGVCVLDETVEQVSVSTGSSPTEGFNSWIYSITFTLLIAFVIAIFLFLISRVRGKKTA